MNEIRIKAFHKGLKGVQLGKLGKSSLFFLFLFALVATAFPQEKKGFDLTRVSIPLDEIKDGGPPKDGIPSIDKPTFITASEATMEKGGRVLGVVFNGVAKAYPISILNYHEIVNDRFGNAPVVITYCPLCASGLAFDAVVDERTLTFGVSGLLYNSDVLLYDRETESLWSQLKNESVSGEMKGRSLVKIATANTTWGKWKKNHPKTLLLSEKTGFNRDYSRNPYPGYAQSARIYFEVAEMDESYHPKEMVVGLEINGKHKAYPFSELSKSGEPEIEDAFQGQKLSIRFDAKSQSAEIRDAKGNIIPTVMNFWFAWYAFYPETEVYVPTD